VAQVLMERGLTDVHYLKGGFDAWRHEGYPLEPK
jgi:rhodanese-related sulfurtransferase